MGGPDMQGSDDHAAAAAASTAGGGTIGELSLPVTVVRPDVLSTQVDELFRFDESLRCIVVGLPQGPVLVERSWFEVSMTGRLGYGRVLHARRPLQDLGLPPTLVFPADTPVADVAASVIDGQASGTGDAVVVTWPDGRLGVAAVTAVFESLAQHYAHQSLHDPLTGLPNRLYLMQRLGELGRAGRAAVLLYIDLDRFKDVNDTFGHPAGDQVLVHFARRLRDVSREDDLAVRFGSDEFALLSGGAMSPAQSVALAERLVLAASAPFAVTWTDENGDAVDASVTIGASVGIATSDHSATAEHPDSGEALLKRADLALYRAKSRGRGRAEHFGVDLLPSPGETESTRTQRSMERRLRSALDTGSLSLHYQAVVELPSGRVVGAEALARWHDAELGSVPPDKFIPLAERTGLILDLGRWALRTACLEAADWTVPGEPAADAPTVSVNVSPVQLGESTFVAQVAAALADSGLAPQRLCLEITETAAIGDLQETAALLHELTELGVRVALDDFGTGHSSLTMLRNLPVDVVKVDRSFVASIATNANDAVLVRLVIESAHSLGLQVCAEGIEDIDQAQRLIALGCDSAQGWLFGMPEPPSPRLTALMRNRPSQLPPPGDRPVVSTPLVPGSDELVLVTTPDRTITYISSTSVALLGWTPAQLVGTSILDYLHPDDLARLRAGDVLDSLYAAGTATHRIRCRDGGYRWLQSTTQRLNDDEGAVRQVLSVSRDVTLAVDARRAATASRAQFHTVFDRAPVGMTLTSLDGTFLRVNDAFAELVGRPAAELVGRRVDEVTHPQDRRADEDNLAELVGGARTSHEVDKRYTCADGRVVPVRVRAALVGEPADGDAHVVAHVLTR